MVRINLSYQSESDGAPKLSADQMTAFEANGTILDVSSDCFDIAETIVYEDR